MTLYDYYRSSAAYRVRIALNYKELAYDRHEIHLTNEGGQQHKPEYQAINPQQLVPALVDEGEIVTQSLAILEYLEEKYPTPHILPKDLIARAYVRSIGLAVACDIHPLNNLRVLQYIKHT
ncbi:MAG: glutathione S-transferase N-terminal domain-containing protein, partial [Proteobacteria bacterium]|nr:glutathione S-transferase N-terminal domain-containing protein [Pseudomonadota bacterium]